MAVIAGLGARVLYNFLESADVLGQLFGSDGGVFHERKRLGAALDVIHQPESVLPHGPHLCLFGRGVESCHGEPKFFLDHVLFELIELISDLLLRPPVEFDD